MEIDFDNLIRFGVLLACCVLGLSVFASAIYIFHYASEQTKPTDKNSKSHFAIAWVLIVSLILFGVFSVVYVVKYHHTHHEYGSLKSLREAAKNPLFK